MVTHEDFSGREKYTIASDHLEVSVMDLGATCLSIKLDGKEMILGFDQLEDYEKDPCHIGVIVGRYGNRIAGARCTVGGLDIRLSANEGENQLHGGFMAFDKQIWTVQNAEATANGGSVRFEHFSPDGDNGYPGNLNAAITYSVDGNEMQIDFEGISDADTIYAPTTHMYFNLGDTEDVLNTEVKMRADRYLPVDENLIPTGILPVDEDFDFREFRRIKSAYDHCFIVNGEKENPAFEAKEKGLHMSLWTDYPSLQFYTGKKLKAPHHPYQGFAIEPEAYPNSPNREDFPSPILRKGEKFHRFVRYRFEEE